MKLKLLLLSAIVGGVGATFAVPLQPSATSAETRAAIQTAIGGAAQGGTIELGEGTFEIDEPLALANGVTLKGQGWAKTTLRQTAKKQRVATLDGGAKLVGVTVTGGNVSDSWAGTAGVQVNDGTVSWCRITENKATGRNSWGGGVAISKGTVDHSILDHNQGGDYSGGGGISVREPKDEILVDTCLIYCNTAPHGQGGGFYAALANSHKSLTVRNLTIVGNTAGTDAGGFYMSENGNSCSLSLKNTILADNTAGSGDANLVFFTYSSVEALRDSCAGKSSGNVFANGTAALGADSKSVAGSGAAWFKNVAGEDYHLVAGADPVEAGLWYEGIVEDLDSAERNSPKTAAGCYEFGGALPTVVPDPTFSPESMTFSLPVDVALTCKIDGVTIYYTLDGTDPTSSDTRQEYAGSIRLTATTTIKAFATRTDMGPSQVVTATYEYEEPAGPTLGAVTVTPKATTAVVSGAVTSVGNNGATACDVYLSLDGGAAEKIAAGVTSSFSCRVAGLSPETSYSYVLSVSNDAAVVMGASTSGSFTTPAKPGNIEPCETPAETRQAIQDAIDGAAAEDPVGTVTLGEGLFEIDAELTLAGGVTLVGQGWEKTIVKQTAAVRVITLDGGARVQRMTLTGGKIRSEWQSGAGALVKNGTISWCCITNNTTGLGATTTVKECYGAGVSFNDGQGQIDHSIIAFNTAANHGGGSCYGGGIGVRNVTAPVLVDTCLVYGNSAPNGNGGGICAYFSSHYLLTVRNTTIANNTASGAGGAIFEQQNNDNRHFDLLLVNDIVADNSSSSGSGDSIAFNSNAGATAAAAIEAGCKAQSYGNVLANGVSFGENSTTVDGSGAAWFVNAAENDYHLASGSAPIRAGKPYDGLGADLDGVDFNAEEPSAGCYEFGGSVVDRKGLIIMFR